MDKYKTIMPSLFELVKKDTYPFWRVRQNVNLTTRGFCQWKILIEICKDETK